MMIATHTPAAEPTGDLPFVETSLHRAIEGAVKKAGRRRKPIFIYGESQIGKTTSLEELARRDTSGRTIYVRMPTGGALGELLTELALVLDESPGGDLKRRLMLRVRVDHRLIVDECHEALAGSSRGRGIKTLNWLRELWDRRRCALVLCGTNVFRDGMTASREARNLRQLVLRGLPPLQLPSMPSGDDLDRIAVAAGLPPAPEEAPLTIAETGFSGRVKIREPQHAFVERHGLGRWIAIIQDGADLASEAGKPTNWGYVHRALKAYEAPEKGGK